MTNTKGTVGALEHLRVLDLTDYLGRRVPACSATWAPM